MTDSPSTFWSGRRKKFWIVGAVLILITAGVVGGMYAREMKKESAPIPRSAAKGELSAYLSDEFKAVAREGTRLDQKFTVSDMAQFGESLHLWVGQSRELDQVFPGGGVTVTGMGAAAVPGPGKSAHLRIAPPKPGVEMSLFIQKYMLDPVLGDDAAYSLPGRALGAGAPEIVVWHPRGGLVFYLVSNSKDGIEVLRKALNASEPNKPY